MENILDNNLLDLESIKQKLRKSGIHDFHETENQKIIVSESHTVEVTLTLENDKVSIKRNFPQVGNTIQIIMTVVFIIVFSIFDLPFSWIAAILLGQVVSYGFHMPKINRLEKKVNAALEKG